MIYVAGGTVHTLGPGSVVVETQQQSDTTYRLYDYGRPRELHLKDGMAAVKEKVKSGKVVRPAPEQIRGSKNRHAPLVAAPYFVVDMFEVKEPLELATRDDSGRSSVQILVAVEGCGAIAHGGAGAGQPEPLPEVPRGQARAVRLRAPLGGRGGLPDVPQPARLHECQAAQAAGRVYALPGVPQRGRFRDAQPGGGSAIGAA